MTRYRSNLPGKVRLIACLYLLFGSGFSLGNIEKSIAYIEQLLAEGKKVAVLYIDMQKGFQKEFLEAEFSKVFQAQLKLLTHFSGSKNIYFVDINYNKEGFRSRGPTLFEALAAMEKQQKYKLFLKSTDSAFRTIPVPGESIPSEQIQVRLRSYLRSEGTDNLFVMGCFDGSCIRSTVEDALNLNFHVAIDRDLNISYGKYFLNDESTKEKIEFANVRRWEKMARDYPDLTIIPDTRFSPCKD